MAPVNPTVSAELCVRPRFLAATNHPVKHGYADLLVLVPLCRLIFYASRQVALAAERGLIFLASRFVWNPIP